MDSKVKRLMILAMLCMTLVIAAIVVLVNYNKLIPVDSSESADEAQQASSPAVLEDDGKVRGADTSAFLNDDTFFDADTLKAKQENAQDSTQESGETEENKHLSMLATSVEKDIRVKVVDDDGELVSGQGFMIDIDGVGSYKDFDEDGIIYISNLKPGEYSLKLCNADDYIVSDKPLKVNVKAIVSYMPIDDITYLIKNETDVDVSAEDTEIDDAEQFDSDESQYTSLLEEDETGNAVELGIDVSKWNGDIDWDVVKAEGVDFAIIRCGYRGSSSGCLVEDPYFKQNLAEAKKAGINVGIYFFTQATNMVEAVEEASMVITLLGDNTIDYPVFIDTEGAGGNGRADGLDTDTRTAVCQTFCKTIENAGYQAGIYASRNWFKNNLYTQQLDGYNIWLAEYRQTPMYDERYDMWQYTSSGSVAGINGRVDLNVSYIGSGRQNNNHVENETESEIGTEAESE